MVRRRFGKWKVLRDAGNHRYPSGSTPKVYECRCDCGTIAIIKGGALRAGTTKSCGCSREGLVTIGRRFGKLTVLEFAGLHTYETGNSAHKIYKCRCDCGKTSYVFGIALRSGHSRSCGCGVGEAAKKRWARTRKSNFLGKINMSDGKKACWEWQGSCDSGGYGMTSWKGKMWKAHRLAYTLLKTSIPKGKFLLHSGDNRKCCNPLHLRPGNQWENIQDMVDRRRTKGKQADDKNPMAKLSFPKARKIRRLYASGWSQQRIGDRFGVSQFSISMIVRNKRYVE